ncbi:helitron helicase-like domain-containing protein [Artemisia annua]|uniref:Helitron helicase-like domain-containing protein n=1 Tax=Artemisia annua TaxID=35608 RepID=A0A2U1PXW6_ARTAN|nr:helitron helicase-like domain-containing protein [Artemisia annua]
MPDTVAPSSHSLLIHGIRQPMVRRPSRTAVQEWPEPTSLPRLQLQLPVRGGGASDNDVNLPLDVATADATQSVHMNNKRKAPPNMTARNVRRRLSTNTSQTTSFEHSAGQSNFHQSEDQSPVYEDLGDCNERCRYCKAAFWHGERLQGHRDTRYNLCCGGGKVFRTARDKCAEHDIPEFKVRLYNGNGARDYELPTSQAIGAIVFDSGPTTESDYDIIIEYRDGPAKRINKLHQSYMSLQFPLIFIYGQPGYHIKLMTRSADPNERMRRVSMNAFYTYQIHPRHDSYNLLFRTGRLFQQYVVGVYCCLEQNRMDFYRTHQDDIRGEYLSGLYDAVSRGNQYSGPMMLDFSSQTVHHLSYNHLDFNKENDPITARELRMRDAATANETPLSLPTFFSGQRLKRSNVAGHATHKRRKITRDGASGSNTNEMNESCLSPSGSQVMSPDILHDDSQQPGSHGTKQESDDNPDLPLNMATTALGRPVDVNKRGKAPANVTTRYVRQRLSATGSHSSLADGCHDHNGGLHSHAISGIDKNTSSLLPITEEIPTFTQPNPYAPTGLQNSGRQSDIHQSPGASDNDVNLPLDVATADATQSVHMNNKRKAPPNMTARNVRRHLSTNTSQTTSFEHSAGQSNFHQSEDQSPVYEDLGDCNERYRYCKAAFLHGERLQGHRDTRYNLCCGGGKVYMESEPDPPHYIRQLLSDGSFMQHIRGYNQMFAMTSFGANIDNTINHGRGLYVFKVSGQVYHQIGSLCPTGDDKPCFLQLYIYDTQNEVQNRMNHFTSSGTNLLDPQVVESLIQFLDTHNELVQVFRTARDKCAEHDVPEFKVRLYNGNGARGYELPTSQAIGAIVFDSGPTTESDYDIIIEYRDGLAKRINKLHQSYMSLQFPLIFIYGQPGYHIKLMTRSADPNERMHPVSMNAFYTYQIHPRHDRYNFLFRTGRTPPETMAFIKQKALKTTDEQNTAQASNTKPVKRVLFENEPAQAKKQRGTYHIFI